MVGRDQYKVKYKWRYRVVVVAFAAFLLAEHGEFFVSHEDAKPDIEHFPGQTQSQQIPEHLPENLSESLQRICRVCSRGKGGLVCSDVILPVGD